MTNLIFFLDISFVCVYYFAIMWTNYNLHWELYHNQLSKHICWPGIVFGTNYWAWVGIFWFDCFTSYWSWGKDSEKIATVEPKTANGCLRFCQPKTANGCLRFCQPKTANGCLRFCQDHRLLFSRTSPYLICTIVMESSTSSLTRDTPGTCWINCEVPVWRSVIFSRSPFCTKLA